MAYILQIPIVCPLCEATTQFVFEPEEDLTVWEFECELAQNGCGLETWLEVNICAKKVFWRLRPLDAFIRRL